MVYNHATTVQEVIHHMKQYFEIVDVMAREILDSRGNPTVEAASSVTARKAVMAARVF